jgi:hypothetical protein
VTATASTTPIAFAIIGVTETTTITHSTQDGGAVTIAGMAVMEITGIGGAATPRATIARSTGGRGRPLPD